MKFVQKAALIIAILLSLILVFSAVHAFPQDTTADIDTTGDSGNIRFFKSTFLDSVDLDNDGKAEIILNNLDWGEYTDLSRFNFANGILNIYQLSGGSLKQKSSISANTPFGIAYGNFDGEGGLDIVTITVNPQGGHTITRLSAPNWNIAAGVGNFNAGRPTAIAAGDFVGDGLDDIVIGVATVDGDNLKSPKFLVCENQDGTFNCDTTIDITQDDVSDPIYDIAVGDIGELQNGNYAPPDTRDDIVLVTRTGRVVIQYQNSIVPKTFNSKQLVQAGFGYSNTKSVEIGDINGDDLNDIVVGNSDAGKNSDGGNNPDNVVAYFHVPGIGFGFDSLSVMDLAGAGYPIDLEIGDIDQDGLNDVVVVNGQGTKINIFLQNEQNRLPSNPSYSLTTDKNQVFGIGIGDLDGDHLTDISAVTVTGNLIHAFLQENNPPEILEMAVTPSLTSTNFAVSFMAEVSDVEDNLDLTTVSWSSSIDKDLSLSDLDSEYQGLSVGVHDITFEVCDLSGGCSSKTLEAAVEIYPGFDGVPQLANPPILPRLSTVSESIYTYNQAPCPTAGIAQQGATAGTIEINASINENRVLSFTTTEDIIGDGSGAKYQVYLKNNCELTPIGGLVSLEPSLPDVYKKFNDVIAKPACSQDECEYVVEIMAHSKGDVGGTVETFTFIPTIEGESLNAVSGKAQYLPNEVALIRAIATTDEMLSVTYTFDYPESMRGTSGRMSYSGVKKEYRAYVPLGEAGSYVIDITARLINEP
ncbi:MAG: VCBS repeat-containing protein, partial [Candidatus Undinarchaeales archaeon]|nr:VCBS repeat-containing protein [Candidatus Undinarchaeales archaeon]